ncbi:hypothetical protein [Tenacibaculum aestuariivivum]
MGSNRELKKACEQYWSGKILTEELQKIRENLTFRNWKI